MINFQATAAHRFRAAINFTLELLLDWMRLVVCMVRSRATASAEILFLRKQLAFYHETPNQAKAVDRGGPGFSRFLVPVVQLERITGDRQT